MNVKFFRSLKAQNQHSMDLYEANLVSELNLLRPEITTTIKRSNTSFKSVKNKSARRIINTFDQLIRFPFDISQQTNDGDTIYHITDHVDAYLLSSLDKERTIVTCHDVMPLVAATGEIGNININPKSVWSFKYRIKRIGEAAHIIAVSENTKIDIVKFNLSSPDKISVIHPGLNYQYKPLSTEKRRQLRNEYSIVDKFVLLHIGSSLFYKNVDAIINTLKLLTDDPNGKDYVFLKAGQQFTATQMELIERYGLTNRVKYVGSPASFQEMEQVYNLANVFVFPSLYEGFGWPPLEAMACGIPVVCSDRGSLREIVGSDASICDPNSPESIASSICLLRENQQLSSDIISKGLERVLLFNWRNTAEEVLKVYEKVLY